MQDTLKVGSSKSFRFPNLVVGFGLLLHAILMLAGLWMYPGNQIYFLLFSLAFGFLLFQTLRSFNSPSFLFFGAMLWLGFFNKIVAHLVLQNQFIEPTGEFIGKPAQWDHALLVASIGAFGACFAKWLIDRKFKTNLLELRETVDTPLGFKRRRFFLYSGLVVFMLFIAIVNLVLGINISGMFAITVLPWPLNAVIGWFLYIGLAILAVIVSQWEFNTFRESRWGFFLSAFEGLSSSISIVSRGLLLFHIIPIMTVNFLNLKKLNTNLKNGIFKIGIIVLTFIASSSAVSLIRYSLFDGLDLNRKDTQGYSFEKTLHKVSLLDGKLALITTQFSGLIVDRWVGAEGVLAVSSYPEKSINLIFDSLRRVPKVGEVDIYEKISKSVYLGGDKYSFATIPGPIAFFYYSGSLILVFSGIALFVGLMFTFDWCLARLFTNAFLSAQLSFYVANSLAQFGISPRPLFISFFMTACSLAVFYAAKRLILERRAQT